MSPKVVIVGAGLVGTLNACYFAKRGWEVEVYELRSDIRKAEHVQGRSINLALSERGKAALRRVDLEQFIASQGVPMLARLIHDRDGVTTNCQPYGRPGQHIVSINRRQLNEVMLSQADRYPTVKFFFEHKLLYSRIGRSELIFERLSSTDGGGTVVAKGDLLCACDGAHSALRRSLMAYPRFDCQQRYIEHGYIELNILPTSDGRFALEPNVFHLWPRGNFVLIALANRDKTFTVTLFAPFDVLDTLADDETVERFFVANFPDALRLIGRDEVLRTFREVAVSTLLQVKCSPHNFNRNTILLGDAAHAMVPFYGQGMNCGFEDVLVLSEMLDKHNDNIAMALDDYSNRRCKDAHAICDLAMYNYLELRDLVNSPLFRLRKKLDTVLHRVLKSGWTPLYSMVTFSRTPYHRAVAHRQWQDRMLQMTSRATLSVGFVILLILIARRTKAIRFLKTILQLYRSME